MHVSVVGPAEAPPFDEVMVALRHSVPAQSLHFVRRPRELDRRDGADLVLVLQQWPDEYSPRDVLGLIDAAPLARLRVCFGPWCDSDGRTRSIWPPVTRVPVADAPARVLQEIADVRARRPLPPLTADRSEAWQFVLEQHPQFETPNRLSLAIVSPSRALTEMLQDVLMQIGHGLVRPPRQAPDAVVFDADPWGEPMLTQLDDLRRKWPGTPVVALCGFPRPDNVQELRRAGVAAVVSKSADNTSLLRALSQVADGRPCGTCDSSVTTPTSSID